MKSVTAIDSAREPRADNGTAESAAAAATILGADEATPTGGDGVRVALLAVALVALTIVAFGPVIDCGFVNFDDPKYVIENAIVQRGLTGAGVQWAFTTGTLANYHPLTWLSLMLDRTLWGTGALGFHLTNLALHAANAVLLFLVLRRMTGATWRPLLVAALFAVHPQRVEAVVWVSARKDCLAAFFGLLAIAAYVRYAARPSAARYAAVACLFAASLLCKAMFVTLPAVLFLLDHWPLRRARPWRELAMEKLPLAGVALAATVATFIAQRAGGAVGSTDRFPVFVRIANAAVAYLTYLGKAIVPTDLSVFYPYPRTVQLTMVAGAAIALAAITVLAIRQRRSSPWMLIGWLWFLGTFVPMVGFVQLGGQARADRYTYLPVIGLLIAVVWSLPLMRWRRPLAVAAVMIVMTLTLMTRREIGYWRDSVTLWDRALAVTDENYVAHTNLAFELAQRGLEVDAEAHYQLALAARPNWWFAHNGLGVLLAARGDRDGAIDHYEKSLAIRPDFALAHRNLANQLAARGETQGALHHYHRAVALAPDDAFAHLLLGRELARSGDVRNGRQFLQRALRLNPKSRDAQYYAGAAAAMAGDFTAAKAHFGTVLRLDPGDTDARAALEQVNAAVAAAGGGSATPAPQPSSPRSASIAE